MPGQSGPVTLGDARDAQGEIGRRLAGLEEISEEVAQMRGEGLVSEGRLLCRQVLQESGDVGRRDL